jgi:hypothetical protein
MLKYFIINNKSLVSIVIFLIFFISIIICKPSIIFDKNGKPREFGLGYKNKTILPIWLLIILFAIISYLFVLIYINFNIFSF